MGSCVSEPWGTHLRLGGAPVQVCVGGGVGGGLRDSMAQPLETCGGRRADGRMTTNPVGQAEGWAGAGWIHPPGHIPPAACL